MPRLSIASDFDFIHAKIHGLRSRVFERDRLDELCNLRTIEQLWQRIYPDAEPADHHSLQRRLLADQVHTLDTVRNHLPQRLRPFMDWVVRRFQVENIKVLLRGWKRREPAARVAAMLAPLPEDMELPVRAFLAATSLADFLLLVPHRGLRAAAEEAARHHIETGETFFVEAALDAAFYRILVERQRELPGPHRHGTEELVRLEVEAANVLCLFRLKLNYQMPFDQVQKFLAPGFPHPFRLERLYACEGFEEMVRLVPAELLPRERREGLGGIAELERAIWERLLTVANRCFYRSSGDLGAVAAFVVIKRVELANLIRVIEGVRYGMEPGAIRDGLIRVGAAAG